MNRFSEHNVIVLEKKLATEPIFDFKFGIACYFICLDLSRGKGEADHRVQIFNQNLHLMSLSNELSSFGKLC